MSRYSKILGIASLTALVVLLNAQVVQAEDNQTSSSFNGVTISTAADVAEGQLTLNGFNGTGKELKIMVKKDETEATERWYNVSGEYEISANIIFEDGLGTYNVYAMIKEDEGKYYYGPSLSVVNGAQTQEVSNNQAEETYVSSNSEQTNNASTVSNSTDDIDSDNSEIIELSQSLTAGKTSDREKIEALYTWVSENITYDFDKYNNMLYGNYSDKFGSLSALQTRKGVCYDYSTLLAAMCRASGIEAKVEKGYSTNMVGYHAWNKIFDSQNNEWLIVDSTVESLNYQKTNDKVALTERSSDEYYATSEM